MELIHPAEISGKIMTLLDQAKEEVIIISPYNKFTYWKKLTQRIEKAKDRGVIIKWYIRKNVENNVEQIREIGIEPIEIENLHCKLYLNESRAIVTSMNLHEYSDSSSIDIGYISTGDQEYQELRDFISMYIDTSSTKESINSMPEILNFGDESPQHFNDLLSKYLQSQNIIYNQLYEKENKYGTSIFVDGFHKYFDLIFEPRSFYYRIDLRLNFPYRERTRVYNFLEFKRNELNNTLGQEISFGSQMKRLKLDLDIFDNYEYASWGNKEFALFEPILQNILKTYTHAGELIDKEWIAPKV